MHHNEAVEEVVLTIGKRQSSRWSSSNNRLAYEIRKKKRRIATARS
jgi:hypothetical protein